MQKWIKLIWIISILANLSGVIWFILGSTASFQRSIDLVSTVILVYLGVPSMILIVFSSVLLLFKKWSPSKWWEFVGVFMVIMAMLLMTPQLYKNVDTSGWLTEKIRTDSLQQTSDHRFDYCMEFINLFQKNGSARLYLKNTKTLEEIRIPLELPIKEIKGISWGEITHFVKLEPTTDSNVYLLTTIDNFPIPNEKFEINVQEKTVVKIK